MNMQSVYDIGSLSSMLHEKKKLDDRSESTRESRRRRSSKKGNEEALQIASLLKSTHDEDDNELDPAELAMDSLLGTNSPRRESVRYDATTVKVTEDLADFSIASEVAKTQEDDASHNRENITRDDSSEAKGSHHKRSGRNKEGDTGSSPRIRSKGRDDTGESDEKRDRNRRERKKSANHDGEASVSSKARDSSRRRGPSDESKQRDRKKRDGDSGASVSSRRREQKRREGSDDSSVASRVRSSDRSSAGRRSQSDESKRRDRQRREERSGGMDDSSHSMMSNLTNSTERTSRGRARGTSSGPRTQRNDRKNLDTTRALFDDDVSVSSYATSRSRDVSVSGGRTGRRDRQRRYPNMGDDDSSVASQLSRVSQLSSANQIARSAQRSRSTSRSSSRTPRHRVTSRSRVTSRPQYSERNVVNTEPDGGTTATADIDPFASNENLENKGTDENNTTSASNIVDPFDGDDKEAIKPDGGHYRDAQVSGQNDLDETEVGDPLPLTDYANASRKDMRNADPEQPIKLSGRKKMSKKNKRRLAHCICWCLTLAGLVVGVIFMLPQSSEDDSATMAQATVSPSSLRGSSTMAPSPVRNATNTANIFDKTKDSSSMQTTAPSLRPITVAPTIRLTAAPTIRLTASPTPAPMMPTTPEPTLSAFGISVPESTAGVATGAPVAMAPVSTAPAPVAAVSSSPVTITVPIPAPTLVAAAPASSLVPATAPTTGIPVVEGTDEPTPGAISLPTVKLGPPPTPTTPSTADIPSMFLSGAASSAPGTTIRR